MNKYTAHEAFRRAIEEAAKVCEDIAERYDESERHVVPELRERASTSADEAADAIRAIPNPYPAAEWVKVSDPELIAKARRLEALEEAMLEFLNTYGKEGRSFAVEIIRKSAAAKEGKSNG